jgi:small subunit ribosomal protein S17
MADEDVKGTSADAEVPDENQTEPTEVEETPAETASADADVSEEPAEGASADAELPDEHAEAEVEAETEGGADAQASGTSAEAEVPKKRKRLARRLRPRKTRPTRARSTERKPIVRLETPEHERGRRQERQGLVVSDAMEKTIVVEVAVVKAHPRYKKVVRRTVKFHAHDERSEAKVGDLVKIVETRPLSRTKRWRLVEILEAAK